MLLSCIFISLSGDDLPDQRIHDHDLESDGTLSIEECHNLVLVYQRS